MLRARLPLRSQFNAFPTISMLNSQFRSMNIQTNEQAATDKQGTAPSATAAFRDLLGIQRQPEED
ncbi:unnamed protein product [Rhizopus microsporus]